MVTRLTFQMWALFDPIMLPLSLVSSPNINHLSPSEMYTENCIKETMRLHNYTWFLQKGCFFTWLSEGPGNVEEWTLSRSSGIVWIHATPPGKTSGLGPHCPFEGWTSEGCWPWWLFKYLLVSSVFLHPVTESKVIPSLWMYSSSLIKCNILSLNWEWRKSWPKELRGDSTAALLCLTHRHPPGRPVDPSDIPNYK